MLSTNKRSNQVAAIAVEKSRNSKIAGCSATMVSQASCPRSCKFYANGCYAESGPTGFTTHRLNRSTETKPEAIARIEAKAISQLSGKRPLRLHVVGDCTTDKAAKILSSAAESYPMPVWSYTHAWRTVSRVLWGKVSILASCETAADVI